MFPSAFWVRAEMNKLNHNAFSGHAYPELVEKSNGKVISEMRATLFRSVFQRSNEQFEESVGQPLHDGINVLLYVKISFSPIYVRTRSGNGLPDVRFARANLLDNYVG